MLVEHVLQRDVRNLLGRADLPHPRVVDQHVDAAEARDRLLHDAGRAGPVAHVMGDGQ